VVHRALAFTHAGFGGLGGHGLVRENAYPDATTALDVAHDGTPGRFNLALGDPGRFKRLEAKFAKLYISAAQGLARHAASCLLAVLNPLCITWRFILLAHVNVGWFRQFFFFRQVLARVNPDF